MYLETKEPFNKKYNTWILAYCVDYNEWFVTNERGFYYEYENEFQSENDAINYFIKNKDKFLEIQKPMCYWNKKDLWLQSSKGIQNIGT